MKGLVLSGGKGTRLRPFTYTGAKQLVPLANKPVLFYVLEDLIAAGITDIGVVVGETGDQVQETVGAGSSFGCEITYIQQGHAGGLAHAVKVAREFLGDDHFVMYLGDNVIEGGIGRFVDEFRTSGAAAQLLLSPVPDPREFGVVEVSDGRIVSLEEKPADPKSDLALMGIFLFSPLVHDAIADLRPSARGELEITHALERMLASGETVTYHIHTGWWIDTGHMDDLLAANRLLLHGLNPAHRATVPDDCIIQGRIDVDASAVILNSTLRGPLVIGPEARIENAYVGPFTAVGPRCTIRNSEIEHSIVMERSQIIDVPYRIEDSVIGRDAVVTRSGTRPIACKLTLGDHGKVGLP